MPPPPWLEALAAASLSTAAASAVLILGSVLRRPQHMAIMNWVWPITGLWAGPLGLWAYLRWGRHGSRAAHRRAEAIGKEPQSAGHPFPVMQIAMLAGFLTSYPVNWWLIRRGIKEAM